MKSDTIRTKFFDFFMRHNHVKVSSSSLIPAQDPTLLFTNAGMNQFKDVFLGKEKRNYIRAVSIQKCMRAGGKHSDLDNVGFTNRHLTFFEMLGNFSFGDYFKPEAIRFAWDFLTKELGLPAENLYVTVFKHDDEAYAIWHQEIGLPTTKISRLDEKDNFWQMGDVGPCGPCTEIYVDRGEHIGCKTNMCAPGCSCDRYLEIWNLVFMQYDRQPDGTDVPLQQTGVDTGMGLERLCLIMQQKNSIFEIDLFEPLLHTIGRFTNYNYKDASVEQRSAFHVLVDHIRAVTFLISDGATPSNDGRGYVLRKIIRRAALFAQKLTNDQLLFPALVDTVVEVMSPIYHELITHRESVKRIVVLEVEKFAHNLMHGQHVVKEYMNQHADKKIITGQQAFKLYDTYGFPLELTRVIAHEHDFTVDIDAFDALMQQQRELSGAKTGYGLQVANIPSDIKTEFIGYRDLQVQTTIQALIVDNQLVQSVATGQDCWLITTQSPFYVEKGGQVSDRGIIQLHGHQAAVEQLKRIDNAIAACIKAPTELHLGQEVTCIVNKQFRLDVMNNHTATHLLQSALMNILGKQVRQSGSLVHPDYLRFDFTYHQALTAEQIQQVEDIVNEKIRENIPLNIYETTYEDALNKGVIAIFGEKYNPEKVRVIDITEFSRELCGGTHVRATGDIGCFKVTQEMPLSTGQRRIVAVTGRKAVALFQQTYDAVKALGTMFKVQEHEVVNAVAKQQMNLKQAQSTIRNLKKENMMLNMPAFLEQIENIHGVPFGFFVCKDCSGQELKELGQHIADQKAGFYVVTAYDATSKIITLYAHLDNKHKTAVALKEFSSWLLDTHALRAGGKETHVQGGGVVPDFYAFKNSVIAWVRARIRG